MLTVGILFIVASGIQSSSRFENVVMFMLGDNNHKKTRYLRLMLPVSALSAFLNNTPIVASLIPMVNSWAKKNNFASSRLLIPLSYAAIFGGICTLIGTSTNLVVHGMMLNNGLEGFSFFEIGKVGLPIALFGILFFSIWGYRLLPDRKDTITQFEESTRKFVVELKANDTLFLLADKNFAKQWYNSLDFSLVTSSVESYSKPEKKGNLALILMVLMVLSATLKLVPIMIAAALTAIILILTNTISFTDAKKSVDFDVLIIIASAFGIGTALINSGLADLIASSLIDSLKVFGMIGIVAGLFIITSIYTEIITNNAGAAIIFPIALSVSQNLGIDPLPFIMSITIGASASFATPIGYQTNLLVYNVGGYKFSDFLKTGLFMNILAGVISTFMIWLLYFR